MAAHVLRFRGSVRNPRLSVPPELSKARGSATLFMMVLLPAGTLTALVLVGGKPYFKLFMACLFFALLLFIAAMLLPMRGARSGVVRVSRSGPLRFASPAAFGVIIWAMLLIAVAGVIGIVDQSTGAPTIPQGGGFFQYSGPVLLAVGILGFAATLRTTRRPTGLTLNREGVLGDGALITAIQVPWSDLEIVELGIERDVGVVRLYDGHGKLHVLKPILLGSDPTIIAESIEYFRSHPEDRWRLDDPHTALALVGDFTAA